VIAGASFAGFHAARRLSRLAGHRGGRSVGTEVVLVNPTDPEGTRRSLVYDRLPLAAGSVTKPLPIPGVAEHAHGFRSIAEALYLRDHLLRQLKLTATTDIDHPNPWPDQLRLTASLTRTPSTQEEP
jgi:hypothetical protein